MDDSRNKLSDLLSELLGQWSPALCADGGIEIGLSGGLDSMVLLDLLWRCREQRHFHLSAVHVHHGLSPDADAWVEHCRQWCARYAVSLRVEAVTVAPRGGESLEAVARERRYAVYAASSAGIIALAHHQDDQAETVLLQLLRGGGAHALAAMPALRDLGDKALWRPMLGWPRSRLESYAAAHGLRWVNDASNADIRWRRNLLRHEVLPLIARAIPDYRQHLQRSARLMGQAAQILDEIAQQDLAACLRQGRLALPPFCALSPPRQAQTLLYWLKQLGWGETTPDAIDDFCRQIRHAAIDRHPQLRVRRGLLLRYRDQLWPVPELPAAPAQACRLSGSGIHALSQWGGVLSFEPHAQGVAPALLAAGFELRARQGGERLTLEIGSKPVKTLLQEAGIPPLLRSHWPLLYLADGRLAALPSVAVALDCRAEGGHWPLWRI